MATSGFQAWDYVVFVAILLLSAGIGVFFAFTGGRNKTNQEFLMANRQMSVLPVAISMVVTIISAITLVGTPGEMYVYGTELWLYSVGASLGYILTALLFVPLLYPLKLTSAYEYLDLRFKSKSAKLVGTCMTIINAILYMGVAMYAPATALETVTGSPVWVTLLVVFAVSSFYSALGGIKAVIWVDAVQSFIMIGGVLAIIIKGTAEVGGIQRVFELNSNQSRIEFFHFDPDPTIRHTFWTIVVGGMVDIFARTGVYQAAVQRYCSVPTITKAKLTTFLNAPLIVFIWSLSCLSGVVMFAYYADKGCDPLRAGYVKNPNQLITYFLAEVLAYPGVPGLFVGSIFSAVLSTISSIQSAVAAITWEDMMKPCFKGWSEEKQTWITKSLVVLYGALGTGVAFLMAELGGTVIQIGLAFIGASVGPLLGLFLLASLFPWANWIVGIAFVGASVGPLLGLFMLGAVFPFSNWIGAVVGGVIGLAFPLWISFGAYINRPPVNYLPSDVSGCINLTASIPPASTLPPVEGIERLYTISYQYNGCIGMATVVVIGLIVSLITGPTKLHDVEPKYLMPFFDYLFCCLPNSWRRKLQCGIDHDSVKDSRKYGFEDDKLEDDASIDNKIPAENGHVNIVADETKL